MLIRRQDKEALINVDSFEAISLKRDDEKIFLKAYAVGRNDILGEYSTKAKALKVLDMIQEAYANAELIPMAVPNIAKMFTEAPASKENELLAEAFGEALMNKMVFQMPADSKVEA